MSTYTRKGDGGETGLLGGRRVSKSHPRIEALGDLDELSSAIGCILALRREGERTPADFLGWVQARLLAAGAVLARDEGNERSGETATVTAADVLRVETAIDTLGATLPLLNRLLLPGGTPQAARTHLARTICRRAERHVVRALDAEQRERSDADANVLAFLNRLSEYLFVLARFMGQEGASPSA